MQDVKSIELKLQENPPLYELFKLACSCDKNTILCAVELLMRKNTEALEFTTGDWEMDADFCMYVDCDSAENGRITNGDKVYIKAICMDEVKVGNILAVVYEGSETADLQKLSHIDDNIVVLSCLNPKYESRILRKEEFDNVHILGKVVGFSSTI